MTLDQSLSLHKKTKKTEKILFTKKYLLFEKEGKHRGVISKVFQEAISTQRN
jgi:hypothetical protein